MAPKDCNFYTGVIFSNLKHVESHIKPIKLVKKHVQITYVLVLFMFLMGCTLERSGHFIASFVHKQFN